jgi:hypothetical protein
MLLIDLLTIETEPGRAEEIAHDMTALAEDLLLSGAYEERGGDPALGDRAASSKIGRDACRLALDRLGESIAVRETALLLGDLDGPELATIATIVATIGPAAIEALKPMVMSEEQTPGFERAAAMVVAFRRPAITRLAPLTEDPRWFVQRNAALLLGRIAEADAVPLLQPLLRKGDPRVARVAVSALGAIPDAAAARAIHTILRRHRRGARRGIDALVADRDARVAGMLARIIGERAARPGSRGRARDDDRARRRRQRRGGDAARDRDAGAIVLAPRQGAGDQGAGRARAGPHRRRARRRRARGSGAHRRQAAEGAGAGGAGLRRI